jgi:hypothetical protein
MGSGLSRQLEGRHRDLADVVPPDEPVAARAHDIAHPPAERLEVHQPARSRVDRIEDGLEE